MGLGVANEILRRVVETCDELIVLLYIGFRWMDSPETDRLANTVDDGRIVVIQIGVLGRLPSLTGTVSK